MENLRAIGLMILAMAAFAVTDMFIKFATQRLPVAEVILIVSLGGTLLFAGLTRASGQRIFSKLFFDRAVILRNIAEAVGTLSMVSALAMAPLALVISINQATPLLVAAGAAIFLGERVGTRRWVALAIGFFGVLIMLRPDASGVSLGAILSLLAAVGLATRDLAIRRAPPEATILQLSTYGFAALVPAGGLWLWLVGGAVTPTPIDISILVGTILAATSAYYAITMSMRMGEVSLVAPFRYSRLPFAFFIGAVVFNEYPDGLTILGAGIVIASGIFVILREHRMAKASIA